MCGHGQEDLESMWMMTIMTLNFSVCSLNGQCSGICGEVSYQGKRLTLAEGWRKGCFQNKWWWWCWIIFRNLISYQRLQKIRNWKKKGGRLSSTWRARTAKSMHLNFRTFWMLHSKEVRVPKYSLIPEQFTVKAHLALFEGGRGEPKSEALLLQSTVDIHFQNVHKTQKTAKASTLCVYKASVEFEKVWG